MRNFIKTFFETFFEVILFILLLPVLFLVSVVGVATIFHKAYWDKLEEVEK